MSKHNVELGLEELRTAVVAEVHPPSLAMVLCTVVLNPICE